MIAAVANTGPSARRSAGVASRQRFTSTASTATTIAIAAALVRLTRRRPVVGLCVTAIVLSGQALPHTRSVSPTSSNSSAGTVTTAYVTATSVRSRRERSRPVGYASRRCPSTPKARLLKRKPSENTQASFAVVSAPASQAKPVASSRIPVRFAGRRQVATRPLRTKLRPAVTAIAPSATLSSVWSLTAISQTAPTVPRSASAPSARSVRALIPRGRRGRCPRAPPSR